MTANNPQSVILMQHASTLSYWEHMGTTHTTLEDGQEGPLFHQVVHSLSPCRYQAHLIAYRHAYTRKETKA